VARTRRHACAVDPEQCSRPRLSFHVSREGDRSCGAVNTQVQAGRARADSAGNCSDAGDTEFSGDDRSVRQRSPFGGHEGGGGGQECGDDFRTQLLTEDDRARSFRSRRCPTGVVRQVDDRPSPDSRGSGNALPCRFSRAGPDRLGLRKRSGQGPRLEEVDSATGRNSPFHVDVIYVERDRGGCGQIQHAVTLGRGEHREVSAPCWPVEIQEPIARGLQLRLGESSVARWDHTDKESQPFSRSGIVLPPPPLRGFPFPAAKGGDSLAKTTGRAIWLELSPWGRI